MTPDLEAKVVPQCYADLSVFWATNELSVWDAYAKLLFYKLDQGWRPISNRDGVEVGPMRQVRANHPSAPFRFRVPWICQRDFCDSPVSGDQTAEVASLDHRTHSTSSEITAESGDSQELVKDTRRHSRRIVEEYAQDSLLNKIKKNDVS